MHLFLLPWHMHVLFFYSLLSIFWCRTQCKTPSDGRKEDQSNSFSYEKPASKTLLQKLALDWKSVYFPYLFIFTYTILGLFKNTEKLYQYVLEPAKFRTIFKQCYCHRYLCQERQKLYHTEQKTFSKYYWHLVPLWYESQVLYIYLGS